MCASVPDPEEPLIAGTVHVLNLNSQPLQWATKRAVVRDNYLYLYNASTDVLEGVLALSVLRVQQSALQERAIELVNSDVRLIIHCPSEDKTMEDWFCALWAASRLTIHSKYKVGRVLGRGRFGKVKEAVHRRTGRTYAIKMVPKSVLVQDRLRLLNEINVQRTLDHPRILKLREVFETADSVHLIMDCLRGGELFDRIIAQTEFSEFEAAGVVSDVADGLQYLHEHGVAHRDIKPENLVFDEIGPMGRIKITDFGLARVCEDGEQLMYSTVGTPQYCAPEVITGRGYTFSADMWSLGVVLYVLLSGIPPFSGASAAAVLEQVRRAQVSFPEEAFRHVSPLAIDVVRGLLHPDPAQRLAPNDVKNSAWVRSASRDRSDAVTVNMRKHAASLRFKRAGLAVIALRRFAQLGQERSGRRIDTAFRSERSNSANNSPAALSAMDGSSPRSAPSPSGHHHRPHSKSAPDITIAAATAGRFGRPFAVDGPTLEIPSFPTSSSGPTLSPSVSRFAAFDDTKAAPEQCLPRPLSMPDRPTPTDATTGRGEETKGSDSDVDEMEVEEAHFLMVHSVRDRAVSTLRERYPPDRRLDTGSGGGSAMEEEEDDDD